MALENEGGTGRTVEQIEAELASIDLAARDSMLKESDGSATAGNTQQSDAHDYTHEARRKGWRPQAEYAGPEAQWVDAKTFIERGERFTKKLETEISTLKAQVASFEGTKKQFAKFFDAQMAKRDQEHSEALSALRLQKSQATRDGDDSLVIELEDRIEATRDAQKLLKEEATAAAKEHEAEQAPAAADGPNTQNPVLIELVADGNDWFQKDEVLTKYAIDTGNAMRTAGDKTTGRAFLDKVAAQVRADFPRRFKELDAAGSSAAPRHATTSGAGQPNAGTTGQSGHNGKTERDLPAADLAIMRQFVSEGLYTKEAFLKSYFSRNNG